MSSFPLPEITMDSSSHKMQLAIATALVATFVVLITLFCWVRIKMAPSPNNSSPTSSETIHQIEVRTPEIDIDLIYHDVEILHQCRLGPATRAPPPSFRTRQS
eukprot:291513_1